MNLVSVYVEPLADVYLWQLLLERDENINISHKKMPTYKNHLKFIQSEPYMYWYLIKDEDFVGSVYLTNEREIGIFLFKEFQGNRYATKAIKELKKLHKGKFLANINPENTKSIGLFKGLGFRHIQNTYQL